MLHMCTACESEGSCRSEREMEMVLILFAMQLIVTGLGLGLVVMLLLAVLHDNLSIFINRRGHLKRKNQPNRRL